MLSATASQATAQAAVPATMTYQRSLADAGGQPLDATVDITFRLYEAGPVRRR